MIYCNICISMAADWCVKAGISIWENAGERLIAALTTIAHQKTQLVDHLAAEGAALSERIEALERSRERRVGAG